jgi:probable addiction module antidote protein
MQRGDVLIVVLAGGEKSSHDADRRRQRGANPPALKDWSMNESFSKYDSADYLSTPEDIAGYLDAVAEENDPAMSIEALIVVAHARRNMSQLARDADMTREDVYKALSPEGNPSFATVSSCLRSAAADVARPEGS